MDNYQTLSTCLKFEVGVKWLEQDAKDDFYPDPISFAELKGKEAAFVSQRKFRLLQFDSLPHLVEHVPKRSKLLREAIVLHPMHRVLYLAALRHLIGKLDRHLQPESYSYRLDPQDPDAHPFPRKMERWRTFHNDFRAAALEEKNPCLVLTDLAAFYDHISCDQLGDKIRGLLGKSISNEDSAVIDLLVNLLKLWCTDGHGIPQNLDPSSFFGSLYLHVIDREMVGNGFRYFRWVDDIRIVSKNYEDAIRALHFLQRTLAKSRLFLATEKTKIIRKDDSDFSRLLDVEDDTVISEIEEQLRAANCKAIQEKIDLLFSRLEFHAGPEGDDRKFRAFANRLLDVGEFESFRPLVHQRLQKFVIPRLKSHPERSDYWVRMLAVMPEKEVVAATVELLVTSESLFTWQKMHLWRLALALPRPLPQELRSKAFEVASDPTSETVAAQAIVFLGATGDGADRERIFNTYFSRQRSVLIQRAILIAIQELPASQRTRLFAHVLNANSDHKELIEYLSSLERPNYGCPSKRTNRICPEIPTPVSAVLKRGVGLVRGRKVSFTLTKGDFDYE